MCDVKRIIQAYTYEDGRLKNAARPGCSRCTLEESDRLIVAAAVADPFQSAQQIKTALDLQIPGYLSWKNSGYISEVHSSSRCAVNVWGAVSKDGPGPLVRLSRSFTAGAYCEILDSHLLPYALDRPFKDGCFWFQQDLSPVHTT
ncbi:hypothetical protein MRX96_020788 [Rhipicephalus microplus]